MALCGDERRMIRRIAQPNAPGLLRDDDADGVITESTPCKRTLRRMNGANGGRQREAARRSAGGHTTAIVHLCGLSPALYHNGISTPAHSCFPTGERFSKLIAAEYG